MMVEPELLSRRPPPSDSQLAYGHTLRLVSSRRLAHFCVARHSLRPLAWRLFFVPGASGQLGGLAFSTLAQLSALARSHKPDSS